MILSFKKHFVPKIEDGSKKHTIREDKPNRWKHGNKIHFATGVRTKHYNNFKQGSCTGVQPIKIDPKSKTVTIDVLTGYMIGDKPMTIHPSKMEDFAKNDGFDSLEDFWKWFDEPFSGKIIHWTQGFRYCWHWSSPK